MTEGEKEETNKGETYKIFEDNKSYDEEENEKDLKLRHLQESESGLKKPSPRGIGPIPDPTSCPSHSHRR